MNVIADMFRIVVYVERKGRCINRDTARWPAEKMFYSVPAADLEERAAEIAREAARAALENR